MRLLILGGTVFLGRHVVDAALARGHEVTIYTPRAPRHRPGGRRARRRRPRRRHAAAAAARWDAAIDTSGYDPAQVAASAALDVGHYVFVSSCNAYPDWPDKPVDEDSPTWQDGEGYGPDKAAAERDVLPGGAVVRAGLIVGPHDNVFRLPWWVRRIARGRRRSRRRATRTARCRSSTRATSRDFLLRPGRAAHRRRLQRHRADRADDDGASCSRAAGDAELRWIPDDKLEAAGVEPWMELPLWLPERFAGTWNVGTAQGAGGRAAHAPGRARPSTTSAAWLENGGEAELDDWRAEHRPPRMSAEREEALIRLLC